MPEHLPRRSARSVAVLSVAVLVIVGIVVPLGVSGSLGAAQTPTAPSVTSSSGLMVVGKDRTVRIMASGVPRPLITESGALPSGVTFQQGIGVATLTGTPAAGTGNDYTINITATNASGSDTEPYDFEVVQKIVYPANFCPPALTVGQYAHDDQTVAAYPPFLGLEENLAGSPTDVPDAISFNQSNNYSANSITEDDGSTSGTPPAGSGGKYKIQYSADVSSNVGNVNQDKNLNCTVIIDQPPTFTDAGTSVIEVGQKVATPILIGGQTGYPKTVSVTASGTLPTGLTEAIKASGKVFGAVVRGDPKGATPGDYPITVTGDNGLTSSEEYVLVVRSPGAPAPSATNVTLSTEPSPVIYGASNQTYTATVTGGSSPTGFVQFSIGTGLITVPLTDGAASWTTPASLDANDYTVSATYTGDALNASSTTSEDLLVTPAPTTVILTGPTSVATGTSGTFTATVACSPACGTTPTGFVQFDEDGDDNYADFEVDLVNGQATFQSDPTIDPGLGLELDATFNSFDDAPGDFGSSTASVNYDNGAATLSVLSGDGVASDGTTTVDNGDTVTVVPTSNTEFSAALAAVVSGNGLPPGPVSIDITVGSTDETATLITQASSQDTPSSDPQTGASDYFWTMPPNALSAISASGSATVTISSTGSDDYMPTTETFTLDW